MYIWHLDNPENTFAKMATVKMFSASFFNQSGCLNAVSMPYNNNIIPFSFKSKFFFHFPLITLYMYMYMYVTWI